jgi:lipopolysaccharide transport system permease protein
MSVPDTLRAGWAHRRAWWFTATSRTRARFARTVLGSFWMGISNLLSIAALGFVYGTVFKVQDFGFYIVYLGVGLTGWGLMSGSITAAATLFEANSQNILNTNTNPIFYTLEEWAFQLQTFLQSFLVIAVALSFYQPGLIANFFSYGILPLLNLVIFAYWLPLLICLLGARFRDFYQLVPIVLHLIFLLSPILYEKKSLGELQWIGNVNPLYIVLDQFRSALVSGRISWAVSLLIFVVNAAGFFVAVYLLDRNRKTLPFLV